MADSIHGLLAREVDTETPLQAYDFHKLLEDAEKSGYNNDSDDDSSDFSLDHDDKSTEKEREAQHTRNEKEKADHDNEGISTGGRLASTFAFVKVGIDDSMLLSPRQIAGGINSWPPQPAIYMEQRKKCGNIALRQGMWASNPKVRLRRFDMGFLSQLAQLCLRASLFKCEAQDCLEGKRAMDRVAPSCAWVAFRQWALVAMSCQAAMNSRQRVSRAHTHLVRAVSGICLVLKDCLRQGNRQKLFISYLDGQDMQYRIDLADVSNLIYWMARIQSQIGVGPQKIGRWDHHFIPSKVTLPSIRSAASNLQSLVVCKNRLWNLVNVSDRKQVDLPDIVASLVAHKESLSHTGHDTCSPSKCQYSQMNSTDVGQLHKCKEPGAEGLMGADGCSQVVFPVELLDTNVELGKGTAWMCSGKIRQLCRSKTPYIAISHVWSDGTGVGVKSPGSVNECLFNYFAGLAHNLDCGAMWWDAISIPYEPKARHKALSQMHNNYANARCTVVHDSYLVNFPWSDDEAPCLALVLSTWFTRGWTALELAMSKNVKVLFKDPRPPEKDAPQRPPLIKDLDRDILAQSPARASRAHWLATSLIQRLRRPIENAGDLVTTLAPRSTSWVRDRTVIAALLSGVPDCDFRLGESEITEHILKYVGKIPHSFLLHGRSTMRDKGAFSWSAATLDDITVDTAVDLGSSRDNKEGKRKVPMLDITEAGFAKGTWWCRALTQDDTKTLKPHGNDLSAMMKVNVALEDWERCVLLWPSEDSNDSRALIVIPTSVQKQGPVLRCQFIGTVSDESDENEGKKHKRDDWTVEIGPGDYGTLAMKAEPALKALLDCYLGVAEDFECDEIFASEINKKYDTSHKDVPREMKSSLSGSPSWIEEIPPGSPTSGALMGMGQSMVERAELSSSSIVLAIKRRKKNPMRYLIRNHVRLQPMDLLAMVNLATSDRRVCTGLKILGDVYAENQLIRDAINLYHHAIECFGSILSHKVDHRSELSSQFCRFALGHAYIALTKVDSRADQRRMSSSVLPVSQLQASSPRKSKKHQEECLAEALTLFDGVIRACDEKHTYQRARNLERHRGSHTAEEAEGQTVTRDNSEWINKPGDVVDLEIEWLRLELDTVAELTLLHGTSYAFKMAAKTYKRAIKHFGQSPQELEGFKVCWPRRKTENFQSRNERDKKASEIYNLAMKRFNTLLRGDHPLLLLTYLQLGVNYSHRSMVVEAEDYLKRAERGFRLLSRGNNAYLEGEKDASEHQLPILALTQYHLGTIYLRRHKDKRAVKMFQKCRDTPCQSQDDGVVLRVAAALGLAEASVHERKDRAPALRKSRKLLESAIRELENHGVANDEHRRLVLELRLGIAEVLYLLGGSRKLRQAKVICSEVISGIKNDLQNYGSRGDLDEAKAQTLLARIMKDDGEYKDSCDLFYGVRHIFEVIEGRQSLVYLQATRRIGEVEMKLEHFEEAEMELIAALEGYNKHKGAFDESTLITARNLAVFYTGRKQLKDAAEHGLRAYEGWRKVKGDEYLETADMARQLGHIYFTQCRFSEAKDMYFKAYDAYRRNSKVEGMEVARCAKWGSIKSALSTAMELAKAHAILGGPENDRTAVSLYNLVVVTMNQRSGGDTVLALTASLRLGDAQRMRNQLKEARPLIEHALRGLEGKRTSNRAGLCEAKLKMAQLILDEQQQGVDDGKTNPTGIVREALSGLEDTLGVKDHLTLEAKALLGEILIDDDDLEGTGSTHAKKGMEGEAHLARTLDGCRESFPCGHPTPVRIMDLLIKHWRDRGRQHDVKNMMKRKWKDLKEGFGPDHAAMIMQITDPKRENLFYLEDDDDEFDEVPVGVPMGSRAFATTTGNAANSNLMTGVRQAPVYGQMPNATPMTGAGSSWISYNLDKERGIPVHPSRGKLKESGTVPAGTNVRSPWVYYGQGKPTRTAATGGIGQPPGRQHTATQQTYNPPSFESGQTDNGTWAQGSHNHYWANEEESPSDDEDLASWNSDSDKESLFSDQFDDLYDDLENMEASSGDESSDWEDTTRQANNGDNSPSHGGRKEPTTTAEKQDSHAGSTRSTGNGTSTAHEDRQNGEPGAPFNGFGFGFGFPSSGSQNTGPTNPSAPGWEPSNNSTGTGAETYQRGGSHPSGNTSNKNDPATPSTTAPDSTSFPPRPEGKSPDAYPSGGDEGNDPGFNDTSVVPEPRPDVSTGHEDAAPLSGIDVSTIKNRSLSFTGEGASSNPTGPGATTPGEDESGYADGTDGFDGFGGFPGFFGPEFPISPDYGGEIGTGGASKISGRPDQDSNAQSGGESGKYIGMDLASPAGSLHDTTHNTEPTEPTSSTNPSYDNSGFGDYSGRNLGALAQDHQYASGDENTSSVFDNGYAHPRHTEPTTSDWPGYGDMMRPEIDTAYPEPNHDNNMSQNWSGYDDNTRSGFEGNYPGAEQQDTTFSNWPGHDNNVNSGKNSTYVDPGPYGSGTPDWSGHDDTTRSGAGTSYSNPGYTENASENWPGYESSRQSYENPPYQQPGPRRTHAHPDTYAAGDQSWASREESFAQPNYGSRQPHDYVDSWNPHPQHGRGFNRAPEAAAAQPQSTGDFGNDYWEDDEEVNDTSSDDSQIINDATNEEEDEEGEQDRSQDNNETDSSDEGTDGNDDGSDGESDGGSDGGSDDDVDDEGDDDGSSSASGEVQSGDEDVDDEDDDEQEQEGGAESDSDEDGQGGDDDGYEDDYD